MGLFFAEGFDWLTSSSNITLKWASNAGGSIAAGSGRRGNDNAWKSTAAGRKTVLNAPTGCDCLIGFAIRLDSLPASRRYVARILKSGNMQDELNIEPSGAINVTGGTSLETSTCTLSTCAWYYVEWQVYVDNSGSTEVWVDGDKWIEVSGDTRSSFDAGLDQVEMGMEDSTFEEILFDDIYVIDPTDGVSPTSRLGDVYIHTLSPCADGGSIAWTPSAGSNWQNVDDADYDADTTYNSACVVGDRDSFSFETLPASSASHFGVVLWAIARKTSTGSRGINLLNELSGSEQKSSSAALGNSYTAFSYRMSQSPCGAEWKAADVTNSEFGIEIYS